MNAAATTAAGAMRQVRNQADRVRNDETAVVGTVSVGDVIRQGDLYLVCITGHMPKRTTLLSDRQLAPGNTQGSRHVVAGQCNVHDANDKTALIRTINRVCPPSKKMLVPDRDEPLIGPIVEALGQVEIDHPEHGNRVLPAGEVYAVVYQRAFAEQVRRQQD